MTTTITQPTGDFTNRDFDSWIIELRNRVNAAFPGWTDFNTPNFGNILLEMFAHTLDQGSFYQDQQHLERFATLLRLRRSAITLGAGFSYYLPNSSASSVNLQFEILSGQPLISDLIIPAGTLVSTADGSVVFETTADATLPAGDILLDGVPAQNATAQVDAFVASGAPGFSFPLNSIPYVDNSGVMTVGVQVYRQVPNFFESGPSDYVFTVTVDNTGRATITFGDGTNGAIPSGSGMAAYLTGGGAGGNVEPNTLTLFPGSNRFSSQSGEFAQLSVTNPSSAGGGTNAMTVQEFRVAFPAFIRTSGQRSVTRQDFIDNALAVRGVARALMLTGDDTTMISENRGVLYIVPVGGGLPSSTLQTQVFDYIMNDYPPTLTFQFTVAPPQLLIISIAATVYLANGVTYAVARAAIEQALDNLFSLVNPDGTVNTQIDFGFNIRTNLMPPGTTLALFPFSTLFDTVANATAPNGAPVLREVSKSLFSPANDVPVQDTQFPVLGSILLTDGETGTPF